MSSDEKALKQICYCGHPKERHFDRWVLNNEIVNGSLGVVGCNHCGCREYAHNELLDTHTVKEEKYCNEENCMAKDDLIPHEHVKEESTTLEKKCCKNCGLDYQDPIYCSIFGRSADKHEWM